MAITALDKSRIHEITVECDPSEPKTVFHVRTLTRSQRAQFLAVMQEMANKQPGDTKLDPKTYIELLNLAYRAWEMLVVNITMFSLDVPKAKGEFGDCVPKSFADEVIKDDRVLFEVLNKGMQANVITKEEKKISSGFSGSANISERQTVPGVSSAESKRPGDANDQGQSGSRM